MENSNYKIFKQLHHGNEPLLLANAWDARSAINFEESGFRAIGTSSAAIAAMLGYDDGEKMTFDELLFVVEKISDKVKLPISVDVEGGYSRSVSQICENIRRLAELRVIGVNIEDSIVDDHRTLVNASSFAKIIEQIKSFCFDNKTDVFLNVRTDTYLLDVENRLEQTLERIEIYENAGADSIFIPCLTDLDEIKLFCRKTKLPINVLCLPDLPNFDALSEAGVKRISMGNFMFEFLSQQQSLIISKMRQENSCQSLFLEN